MANTIGTALSSYRQHCLWRAVDQDGDELDILVQKHRDKRAAKTILQEITESSKG